MGRNRISGSCRVAFGSAVSWRGSEKGRAGFGKGSKKSPGREAGALSSSMVAYLSLNTCRLVFGDDRRIEMVVQAGAEDVLLHLGAEHMLSWSERIGIRCATQIDEEIFGLGRPIRSEQAEEIERGFDAA